MSSWVRRAPRVAVVLLVVLFAPRPAYAAEPSPDPSAAYYDGVSLAGSRAGEGRPRPGRAEPLAVPDPRAWRPLPPPPPPERPEHTPPPAADAAEPVRGQTATGPPIPGLRVLPLGVGLALTGLGIGFLGLRLRRG
ncbi:hypothetical protein [Streptomyces sp. NPDC059063]|uniref:hypothetical protein n=1 Tax=unclassified Streptomyces TaxID=2593676 RepID=UPI0036C6DDDF